MQRLIALAVVLILAAASVPVSAGGYYDRDWRYRHRDYDRGAYLAGGLLLGLAAGAALASDRDWRYYDGDDHYYYDGGYGYGRGWYDGGWYDDRPYWRDVVVYHAPPRYYGPVRRGWYYERYYYAPPRYYDRYDRRVYRHYRGW